MPAPPIQPKCKFPCGTIVHHGNPWACPPQGLVTELDPKRFITATQSCEFENPETCERYKRVTLYWNCPLVEGEENTPTEQWFQGATEIPKPSEEIFMALTIYPLSAQAKTCERVDVLSLEIAGPAAAQDYTAMLTAALAANPVSYATFGAAAATDEVLAFNAVEKSGGNFLYNGIETPMINDPDGVNMANELEVPDGCTAVVTFCLQKCLTKAEIAAVSAEK